MSIEPFKIINEDGTTNQSEYERCVKFLNDYVNGDIKVYPQTTWTNPFEVDLSQEKSSFTILKDIVEQETNRLLTPTAFSDIKKLFKGMLTRYGSTIHTYGRYLEESQKFIDGPGYIYDVFSKEETPVLKEVLSDDITIYYLDDDNHTILEYNDAVYSQQNDTGRLPVSNFPKYTAGSTHISGYNDNTPTAYRGNLCGVYSDFQRLAGQYVGSSTLFYYSECNDALYTSGGQNTYDNRAGRVMNYNYGATIYNKSKPTRGVDLSLVEAAREALVDEYEVTAYIPPTSINSSVNYLSPTFFVANNPDEWKI